MKVPPLVQEVAHIKATNQGSNDRPPTKYSSEKLLALFL